jgi:hypothetical protein
MKKKREKRNKICKFLCLAPRILAVLFILFLSLFALDVFDGSHDFPEVLAALAMHLIPAFIIVVFTVIAWNWEKIGGILFILLGMVFTIFFDSYESVGNFLLISAPLFLIGILFILDWYKNRKRIG